MAKKDYPTPDQIEIPAPTTSDPEKTYMLGWVAHFARLWVMVFLLAITNVISLVIIVLQVAHYQPAAVPVTLEGGKPVIASGAAYEVGGVTYDPKRLQGLVETFARMRYEYDFEDMAKLAQVGPPLMTEEAFRIEKTKADPAAIGAYVVNRKAKYTLEFEDMKVTPESKGTFAVIQPGKMKVVDAFRCPATAPCTQTFAIRLTVAPIAPTPENPYGYVITATGDDIIMK